MHQYGIHQYVKDHRFVIQFHLDLIHHCMQRELNVSFHFQPNSFDRNVFECLWVDILPRVNLYLLGLLVLVYRGAYLYRFL